MLPTTRPAPRIAGNRSSRRPAARRCRRRPGAAGASSGRSFASCRRGAPPRRARLPGVGDVGYQQIDRPARVLLRGPGRGRCPPHAKPRAREVGHQSNCDFIAVLDHEDTVVHNHDLSFWTPSPFPTDAMASLIQGCGKKTSQVPLVGRSCATANGKRQAMRAPSPSSEGIRDETGKEERNARPPRPTEPPTGLGRMVRRPESRRSPTARPSRPEPSSTTMARGGRKGFQRQHHHRQPDQDS